MANDQSAAPANAVSAHSAALLANLNADNSRVAARVFRSNIPSVRYIFKNGKSANFLGGKYITDIVHEIRELDYEIALHHPNFSVNMEEVVPTMEPLEALRARFIAEYKAELATNVSKNNDAGYSDQGKLNVANTTTISEGAAGSDSSGGQTGTISAAPASASLSIKIGK